jgi:hypothetical protein
LAPGDPRNSVLTSPHLFDLWVAADFPPETPWEVREEALGAHMEEHIAAYAEQFLRDAEKGEG